MYGKADGENTLSHDARCVSHTNWGPHKSPPALGVSCHTKSHELQPWIAESTHICLAVSPCFQLFPVNSTGAKRFGENPFRWGSTSVERKTGPGRASCIPGIAWDPSSSPRKILLLTSDLVEMSSLSHSCSGRNIHILDIIWIIP